MEWISVKDRLPEYPAVVLVAARFKETGCLCPILEAAWKPEDKWHFIFNKDYLSLNFDEDDVDILFWAECYVPWEFFEDGMNRFMDRQKGIITNDEWVNRSLEKKRREKS